MFVCKECHKTVTCSNAVCQLAFESSVDAGLSQGVCEVCHKNASCVDCHGYGGVKPVSSAGSRKDPLCVNCPLLDCPGPVMGEFTGQQTDIIYVGEALGATEVVKHRPMIGEAGQVLRATIRALDFTSYGITNVWKCRPPRNELPEDQDPGEFCRHSLLDDLISHKPKIIVPLGSTALKAITGQDIGIMKIQGRMFTTANLGVPMTLIPMYHPAFLRRQGMFWRDWELSNDKLKRVLEGVYDYIAPEDCIVHHLHSADEVKHWLTELSKPEYTELVCDVETSAGYAPWAGARIISISIAWSKTESIVFPWYTATQINEYHPEPKYVTNTPEVHELLQKLFIDPTKIWSWYNGQYDTQFFWAEGFTPRIDKDVMLEAHIVDERGSSDDSKGGTFHSLKRDAGIFLDAPNWEYDAKVYAPARNDSYEKIPYDKLHQYNGIDTIRSKHLSVVLTRVMEEEGTEEYYKRVEIPAFNMLAHARYFGIRVDMHRVQSLQNAMNPELERLRAEMIEISGNPFFNPNSYKDKLAALKNRGLDVPDTRKETLLGYEGDELVDAMRAFADCSKILSTYVVGLVNSIYDDLRVHPDWRLPTETGRPRCSDPNLLGMPRKAEEAEHRWKRYVKEQFIADTDRLLVHMDRKQSEVRCMVFLADAVNFIAKLIADPRSDIHGEFTKMLYGAGYTKEQRVLVKMVVFGLIYNREAPSLSMQFTAIEREKAVKMARAVGKDRQDVISGSTTEVHSDGAITFKVWSVRDAQKFIDSFFKLFPEVLVYKKAIIREALRTGKLRGYLGRIRRFGLVNYDNQRSIENQAVNFMPSNLSADLNFVSCAETVKRFGKYGVEIIAPIHDAGLMSIPKDSQSLIPEIQAMWESLPEQVLTWSGVPSEGHNSSIPFPVDVTSGERWSDL